MKTPLITLGLVAFGLAVSQAGNTGPYITKSSPWSGDCITRAGGGNGNGNGNGNGQRDRKRDGSGGNCDGSGACDGSGNGNGNGNGNGQRARKRSGGC